MVEEDGVQLRVRGAIGVEEEDGVGLDEGADVEDIDLPPRRSDGQDDESGKVERQAGTYKNRFLSHQDGGDKVRYPRINLAEVTRLTADL